MLPLGVHFSSPFESSKAGSLLLLWVLCLLFLLATSIHRIGSCGGFLLSLLKLARHLQLGNAVAFLIKLASFASPHSDPAETHNTFLPDTGASVLEWDGILFH